MAREYLGVMALMDDDVLADWLTTVDELVVDLLTAVEEPVVDAMFSKVDGLDGFNTEASLVGDCGTVEVVSIEVLEVGLAVDTDVGAAEVGSNPEKQTEEALQNRAQRKNGV